jgi:hypothetical protein
MARLPQPLATAVALALLVPVTVGLAIGAALLVSVVAHLRRRLRPPDRRRHACARPVPTVERLLMTGKRSKRYEPAPALPPRQVEPTNSELTRLVGAPRLELGTSCSQSKRLRLSSFA